MKLSTKKLLNEPKTTVISDAVFAHLIGNRKQQHDNGFLAFTFEFRNYSFCIEGIESEKYNLTVYNDYDSRNNRGLQFSEKQLQQLQNLLIEESGKEDVVYSYPDADDFSSHYNETFTY